MPYHLEFTVSITRCSILTGASLPTLGAFEYILDLQVLIFPTYSSWKHVTVQPTAFKIGQLIEAQISFTVYPQGKQKYLHILKLRSLCILDRAVVNVSIFSSFADGVG